MRQHALRGQTHPAAKYYRHCCVVIKQTFKQLHVVAGFTYPHKVRQPHSAAAISGRQVVSARDSPPGPSSASELAPAAAPDGTQPRGGQPESPALSQEGQSWREASLPTAEALSTLGSSGFHTSYRRFSTNGQQQLFISTFDLPQEHPPPATLRPFYAPHRQWGP